MLSKAQLQARIGLITSSSLSSLLGLNRYAGPLSAQLEIKGQLPASPPSPATLRGDLCEPACLEFARMSQSEDLGTQLILRRPEMVVHPEGWSAVNTDAVYEDADGNAIALGEAKTVGAREAVNWGAPGGDKVPDEVLVQCCWHLRHWPQHNVVWVPVLFGGWAFEFALYAVHRNQRLIDDLTAEAKAWHARYIMGDEIAPADHRDLDAVKQVWPRNTEGQIEMTPELESWCAQKVRWREIRKQAKENESLAEVRIAEILRDHDGSVSERYSVTYRATAPKINIDWKGVAESMGATQEQIAPYKKSQPGHRRLTVNAKG